MQTQCHQCGKAYTITEADLGQTFRCDQCGAIFQAPAAMTPEGAPPPPPVSPGMAAPPSPPAPPGSGILGQLKVVGVLNIVAGAIALLMAGVNAIQVMSGQMAENMEDALGYDGRELAGPLIGFTVLMALVGLVAGILSLIAGPMILKRSRGFRGIGIVAAILNILSLVCCCIGPGVGIYSLIILSRSEVAALSRGETPAV